MKLARALSRLALLALSGAALAGLTAIYGGSVRTALPSPRWQAERRHRPSAPGISRFPEFTGEVMMLVVFTAAGHIVFRMRLSPAPRSKHEVISLDLSRGQ